MRAHCGKDKFSLHQKNQREIEANWSKQNNFLHLRIFFIRILWMCAYLWKTCKVKIIKNTISVYWGLRMRARIRYEQIVSYSKQS